ncbi:MAG: hypothetical protein ABIP48_23385 [Planctomycetota bacterium]
MDEQDIYEYRYRFFLEKSTQVALDHDKVLVTLFTGIIAGVVTLVVSGNVSYWSAVFFLITAGLALMGLGFCLLHMAFTAKVMALYAAVFGGDEFVPHLIEGEIATVEALVRTHSWVQRCYSSQLAYLFISALAGVAALAIELWRYVAGIGLIVAFVLLGLIAMGVVIRIWIRPKEFSQRREAEEPESPSQGTE